MWGLVFVDEFYAFPFHVASSIFVGIHEYFSPHKHARTGTMKKEYAYGISLIPAHPHPQLDKDFGPRFVDLVVDG